MIKLQKKPFIIFLIVIAAFIWVKKYDTSEQAVATDMAWVQTSPVKQTTFPLEIHAIGSLTARSVELTPEVAGHVDKILFQDGAVVEQGAELVQLDNAVFKARADSSDAQLAYSENNYKRMVLLGKQGAVARQAIDQAEADLKEKKATAQENKVMLSKMTLTAPFAGTVGKSKVNPGDYVTIGQGVVTLTDTKHLHIEYSVPEKFLPFLKLNQAVKVSASAYPGETFVGQLAFISPTINPENRSIQLYAEIPNDKNLLAAGMFVEISQSLDQQEQVLMVPARSLMPILDGQQVFTLVDGKAFSVPVVIGKRIQDEVQILQGLTNKDIVITDGQMKIKNGMTVKVKA